MAPFSIFGQALESRSVWFLVATLLLMLAVVVSENLQRSPGHARCRPWSRPSDGDQSAAIDVTRTKVQVALSAAMASIGGSLLAHYSGCYRRR